MSKMRTPSGKPTAEARKKHGTKDGKFPIFDARSAEAALKLRHHSDSVSARSVVQRVINWARRNGREDILRKAQEALRKDKE